MTAIAAEKVRPVPEKKDEKLDKRRALGRGLESLLPGPRVVAPVAPPSAPPARQNVAAEEITLAANAETPTPHGPDAALAGPPAQSAEHASAIPIQAQVSGHQVTLLP